MSYEPTFPGESITPQYLYEELQRIAYGMRQPPGLIFEVLHAPPDRPVAGMVVCADGTDWNPSTGAGLYLYLGGVWNKL